MNAIARRSEPWLRARRQVRPFFNRKLAIGDGVAMYFDRRPLSLAESEMEVSGGYELIP